MATLKKHGAGKYRAEICVNGIRRSEVLSGLKQTKSWANEMEAELKKLSDLSDDSRTVKDLFEAYLSKLSVKKRGCFTSQC